MYNRYIPKSDGTYEHRRMQDAPQEPQRQPNPPEKPAVPPCPVPELPRRPMPSRPRPRPPRDRPDSAGNFLKQLLPRDFDTADLMVVLLLLLMSGEGKEDQNTALLTLALYLFL